MSRLDDTLSVGSGATSNTTTVMNTQARAASAPPSFTLGAGRERSRSATLAPDAPDDASETVRNRVSCALSSGLLAALVPPGASLPCTASTREDMLSSGRPALVADTAGLRLTADPSPRTVSDRRVATEAAMESLPTRHH